MLTESTVTFIALGAIFASTFYAVLNAGQLSLGQAGFASVAAYTSVLLAPDPDVVGQSDVAPIESDSAGRPTFGPVGQEDDRIGQRDPLPGRVHQLGANELRLAGFELHRGREVGRVDVDDSEDLGRFGLGVLRARARAHERPPDPTQARTRNRAAHPQAHLVLLAIADDDPAGRGSSVELERQDGIAAPVVGRGSTGA